MSEMQELKENADKAYVKQRLDSISEYLNELIEESNKRLEQAFRADKLMMFSFVAYMGILTLALWLNVSQTVESVCTQLMYLIEIFCIARSWYYMKEYTNKDSEWDGAVKILRLMGMLPDLPPRVRNKKPVMAWAVDLVKKWSEQKQKAQDAVYQPA